LVSSVLTVAVAISVLLEISDAVFGPPLSGFEHLHLVLPARRATGRPRRSSRPSGLGHAGRWGPAGARDGRG
jgi:hypothetical protein